jgi:hypothetical protein
MSKYWRKSCITIPNIGVKFGIKKINIFLHHKILIFICDEK